MADVRRRIPATNAVLSDARLAGAVNELGREFVKDMVTAAQERARAGEIAPESVADEVMSSLPPAPASLREVLNATGVLVHTNLGRAPLSAAAAQAVQTASGYTDVEFDLSGGRRARRGGSVLAALAEALPEAGGPDGVHVVNNNAAALLLCALVLAPGKEIVISRGELVEIGDSFRIPDLLTSAGAWLRPVGTTNRTHLADYAEAVGPDTGLVLKVHPSNFRVTGFTSEVAVERLAELGVPVVVDIGSGLLRPHPRLPEEPDAATALNAGADLVTASADKLLGGPQAGLLFGDGELIRRFRQHPAARALRVDKLTLAALEASVRGPDTPVQRFLDVDADVLRERAERLAAILARRGADAVAVESVAAVGGGGAPGVELPSAAVSLPDDYAPRLRAGRPAVVGRVERGRCLLDLRTVEQADDDRLVGAVSRCMS